MRFRPKKIPDVRKIKATIVFVAGLLSGFGSALTGIGAQATYSPSLIWMLGYAPEKAAGVGLRLGFWTALIAVFSAIFLTPNFQMGLIFEAFLLFVGATIGAILSSPVKKILAKDGSRTLGKVGGIVVALLTLFLTVRQNPFGGTYGVGGNHYLLLLGFSLLSGLMAASFSITPAFLLVPALYFFVSMKGAEAIILSLMVTVFASLLPLLGYRAKELTEGRFSESGLFGGVLGAVFGGIILAHLLKVNSAWSLVLFSLVAMFLSSRELMLMQNQTVKSEKTPEE